MTQTHFGFQTIDENEKQSRVRGVFDSVAGRYDVMNDFMSGGLHRLWKREMVASLAPRAGMTILDVAGGTGDIAFRMHNAIAPLPLREGLGGGVDATQTAIGNKAPPPTQPSPSRGEGYIVVCDINEAMLKEGVNRAIDANKRAGLHWTCGNAEALPFPDNHFDAYTIAFGIRNVTHLDKALAEAYRCLKIGGRFLCLEFSQVPNEWLAKLYDQYSFHVIPWIGEKITQDRAAYQYLVESIRRFPNQEQFAGKIRAAGFGNVTYRNMTAGVVALHSGRKL